MLELVPYLEMFQHQRTKEQVDKVYCQAYYNAKTDGSSYLEDLNYIKEYYEIYAETFDREHPLMMDFNMLEAIQNFIVQMKLPRRMLRYYMTHRSRKECHFLHFTQQDTGKIYDEYLHYTTGRPLIYE